MEATSGVRMVSGNGINSYAANSRLQEKAILETRSVLRQSMEEVLPACQSTMVVADLGCSSGANTLLFVSEVIGLIRDYTRKFESACAMEVQFFLNDLPGNDFNLLFRSLEHYDNLRGSGKETPPYYVAGLPGSYYRKFFPRRSVHLFHSSYSLHWRSKVPDEISSCSHLNEGNIYIGQTTKPSVIKLFQEQFQHDFELFLTLRSTELVGGGRMLLTFLGRKSEDMFMHGEVGTVYELVAKSLQSLVLKRQKIEKKILERRVIHIFIGNLDICWVPPVSANVNIGANFYDIEFTREIPREKQAPNPAAASDVERPVEEGNGSVGAFQNTPHLITISEIMLDTTLLLLSTYLVRSRVVCYVVCIVTMLLLLVLVKSEDKSES